VLATVAAFREGGPWLDDLLTTLDARRTQLGELLRDRLPMIDWHPPQATYLAWLNCAKLGADSEPRELFLDRGRIALESGTRFGAAGAGFVRLNFGTSAEVLDLATAGMAAALAG
jgi:cystathionine beta-lyase